MISAGEGKYKVWLKEEKLDNGIVFIIGGGEVSHIGSIVLTEPVISDTRKPFSCTTQVINVLGHKEESIARELAEKVCLKKKVPVICVCGIHVNNATKKEIEILVDNAQKLLKKFLKE
jgi:hypothetical protein